MAKQRTLSLSQVERGSAKLANTECDDRLSIKPSQYAEVIDDYNKIGSYRGTALKWGVSNSVIIRIVDPERYKEISKRSAERMRETYIPASKKSDEQKASISERRARFHKRKNDLIEGGLIEINSVVLDERVEHSRERCLEYSSKLKERIKTDEKFREELREKQRSWGKKYRDKHRKGICILGEGNVRDRTGQKAGELEFISYEGRDKEGHILWKVRCSCGNEFIHRSDTLNSGSVRRCKECAYKIVSDKNTKIRKEEYGNVVDKYNELKSVTAVAKLFGVTGACVDYILNKMGVTERYNSKIKLSEEDRDEIINDYNNYGIDFAAKNHKICKTTVYNILNRRSVNGSSKC